MHLECSCLWFWFDRYLEAMGEEGAEDMDMRCNGAVVAFSLC